MTRRSFVRLALALRTSIARSSPVFVSLVFIGLPPAAAAGSEDIKVVAARPPLDVPQGATATLGFGRFVSSIPATDEVIEATSGPFCSDPKRLVWSQASQTLADKTGLVLKRELALAGYRTPATSDQIFETGKAQRPDLQLGVRVKTFRMSTCTTSGGTKGAMYLDTHWEVFSPKLQKVVAAMDVEGSYRLDSREDVRATDFVERGVAAMVLNLLADPKLVAVATPTTVVASNVEPTALFRVPAVAAPDGGIHKNVTQLRAAVVTVEAGTASGSGFYISKQGYVLTDKHVVGSNGFVKIRTATGRGVPGEVIASDGLRDVALIKIESLPFEPLALQRQDPDVGDEVYAIGSPLGDTFNGTLTKGVMSGYRTVNDLRFIQSDVSILPGSSGGPLLDSKGSVIGLAVITVAPGRGGNLNFFVPIADALDRLHIVIGASGDSGTVNGR